MPGKTILSLAAASVLGLSLAMPVPAKADKLNGWEGFGVGLLAAPLVYGITRPLLGGMYGAPVCNYNCGSYGYRYGYGVPVMRHHHHMKRHQYCASRYRSYDPASGTFLGYDGRRHVCRAWK
jgi:hypothetical protein